MNKLNFNNTSLKYHTLLMALVLFACNKEQTNQLDSHFATHFEFSIQDKEGNDLLDPKSKNSFEHNQIQVYVTQNGYIKVLDNNSNPNFISNERGYYTLHLSTISDSTFLKLSEFITDTITTEFKSGSNYYYNTKMWYNGQLKWDKNKPELPIVITK